MWLLDTAMLGGEDHRSPVYRTPLVCNEEVNFTMGVWGALATWEDTAGTLGADAVLGSEHPQFKAPIEHGQVAHGAVAAFKVEERAGRCSWCRPGSPGTCMADPPVIANGIVFGFGSGESTTQRWPEPGRPGGAAGRIAESTHAVLYALDGQTGKELWSSGDRSRRGTTSADCQWRTGGCTSAPSTACSIASARRRCRARPPRLRRRHGR